MNDEINILPPTNREPAYEMTYEDKVGAMLIQLPIDSIFEIAKHVKTENRDRFVVVVKSYIDRNIGNRAGWEVCFNSTYTKIIKTEYIYENKKML